MERKNNIKNIIKIAMVAFSMAIMFMGTANAKIVSAATWKADGVTYNLKKGTLTISGKGEAYRDFIGNKKIKKVVVKDGIESLGSVMFANCTNLKSVKFGNSLKSIGTECFYNTAIKSLDLPKSCTRIGEGSFIGCKKLKKMSISGECKISFSEAGSDSLEYAYSDDDEVGAFDGVHFDVVKYTTPLKSNVEENFYNIDAKKMILSKKDKVYKNISGYIYKKVKGKLKLMYIPSGVSKINISNKCYSISMGSFLRLAKFEQKVSEINVPDSVKKIVCAKKYYDNSIDRYEDDDVYAWKKGYRYKNGKVVLKSKTMSDAVLKQFNLFFDIDMEGMIKSHPELFKKSGDFYWYASNGELVYYNVDDTEVVIPQGVKIIPEWLFRGNKKIRSVTIPEGVECILEDSFSCCENLEKVVLPSSLKKIETYAFMGCKKLDYVSMIANANIELLAGLNCW